MYDVVIIGGGAAGLTAGIYSARGGLKTLIIEKQFTGGQAATTWEVDNYPGFNEGISGPDLMMKMDSHARKFNVEFLMEDVSNIDINDKIKIIKTTKDTVIKTKTIILTMGAYPKELGLEKEKLLRGGGVSYCATCDGAFYRDKTVAVAGGGNTAVEDAIFLSKFCKKIYLVHRRDELRASKILQEKIKNIENIEFVWDSLIQNIHGDKFVEGISVKNVKTNEIKNIQVDGIFIAIGVVPNSNLVEKKIKMENGHIVTNDNMETNIPGIFAAGDIRKKILRQIVTAASDGATASFAAERYIIETNWD